MSGNMALANGQKMGNGSFTPRSPRRHTRDRHHEGGALGDADRHGEMHGARGGSDHHLILAGRRRRHRLAALHDAGRHVEAAVGLLVLALASTGAAGDVLNLHRGVRKLAA